MATSKKKVKIATLLVERGLAASEGQAKALIMAGKIIVADQRVDKSGALVAADADVRVKGQQEYVSRGGLKLAGALEDYQVPVKDVVALDVGASTGGFTDCLLKHGAKRVIALDVGTNQLAWGLRSDPRVESVEQTDIRDVAPELLNGVQLVVADISFQSLVRVVPPLVAKLPTTGVSYLLLVKPQFELPRELVPSGGVVTDPQLHQQAVIRVQQCFAELGLPQGTARPCRIRGRSGNQEYFLYVET